jgi:hypothetical protein
MICLSRYSTSPAASMRSASAAIKDLIKTYVQYPPRKLQSESYSGPLTLSQYERFQYIRDALAKEGRQWR